jgi:hypothetical protein
MSDEPEAPEEGDEEPVTIQPDDSSHDDDD